MITMTETQRTRRGHTFLPPPAVLAQIPRLYETDGVPAEDKMIYLHYFAGGSDWWVAELGDEDGQPMAYGYARHRNAPDGAEWGYTGLAELEQVRAASGLVIVERDLNWGPPRKFADIPEAQR